MKKETRQQLAECRRAYAAYQMEHGVGRRRARRMARQWVRTALKQAAIETAARKALQCLGCSHYKGPEVGCVSYDQEGNEVCIFDAVEPECWARGREGCLVCSARYTCPQSVM